MKEEDASMGQIGMDNNMDANNVLQQLPVEQLPTELHPIEQLTMESPPSLNFVEAVAQLLETDSDDILTELGYCCHRPAPANLQTVRQHRSQQDDVTECSDYYLG